MCCQFSVIILIPNILFFWGLIIIFFFGYVLNIFCGGPKAKNVRMHHAVTETVCVTAKRPGGLTIGHP